MMASYFDDQERRAEEERSVMVARAIRSAIKRGRPLTVEAIVDRAIELADRGTSYSRFIRWQWPEKWRGVEDKRSDSTPTGIARRGRVACSRLTRRPRGRRSPIPAVTASGSPTMCAAPVANANCARPTAISIALAACSSVRAATSTSRTSSGGDGNGARRAQSPLHHQTK
jgi:hypothetical protein